MQKWYIYVCVCVRFPRNLLTSPLKYICLYPSQNSTILRLVFSILQNILHSKTIFLFHKSSFVFYQERILRFSLHSWYLIIYFCFHMRLSSFIHLVRWLAGAMLPIAALPCLFVPTQPSIKQNARWNIYLFYAGPWFKHCAEDNRPMEYLWYLGI